MTWLGRAWNRLRSADAAGQRRRVPRWLRVALGCLVAVELIYLIGANLFLNLGGLPLAFSATNQVNVTISRGWSVWPGRVHAKNVRFIFQDHDVQFSLDMTSAFMVIHLSELPRQVFHASHLRGEGVVYRMRHRIDPWSKHESIVGTFLAIHEYSSPAVFEARAPERPLTDAESRVDSLRLDGKARLLERGATSLAVNGELKQTELNWGDFSKRGDLGIDARFEQGVLANDGEGRVDLTLREASFQSGGGGDKGWGAKVPMLEVNTHLVQKAGKFSGTARVNAPAARGRIGSTQVRTDLDANLVVDTLEPNASTMHASGAVHLRNAAMPNAPDPISNWWADVKLDSLFARAQKNLELGGTFRANLRDATPGLALLAEQGALPEWVASAFPLRGFSITGSLARAPLSANRYSLAALRWTCGSAWATAERAGRLSGCTLAAPRGLRSDFGWHRLRRTTHELRHVPRRWLACTARSKLRSAVRKRGATDVSAGSEYVHGT